MFIAKVVQRANGPSYTCTWHNINDNSDITTLAKGAEVKTYVPQVQVTLDSKFINNCLSRNKVLGAGRNTI